jgi:hypothetical protein
VSLARTEENYKNSQCSLLPGLGLSRAPENAYQKYQIIFENMTTNMNVFEVFTLLGCYTALIGSQLPKFRDSLLVPSTSAKQS